VKAIEVAADIFAIALGDVEPEKVTTAEAFRTPAALRSDAAEKLKLEVAEILAAAVPVADPVNVNAEAAFNPPMALRVAESEKASEADDDSSPTPDKAEEVEKLRDAVAAKELARTALCSFLRLRE
jgi:hypothetical protein